MVNVFSVETSHHCIAFLAFRLYDGFQAEERVILRATQMIPRGSVCFPGQKLRHQQAREYHAAPIQKTSKARPKVPILPFPYRFGGNGQYSSR
jgi:hypothetical protein